MRYLLSGWTGHSNLGDDLLLYCTVSGIQARDPNADIVILSYCVETTNELCERWGISDVKVVQRLVGRIHWRWQLWRLARRSDYYVITGGSAIRDFSTASNSIVQQYKMAQLAYFAGCYIEFIGLGAGPIWRSKSKRTIKRLFRFAYETIRDNASYNLLISHGASKISHTADLVFSMAPIVNEKDNKIKHVGLVLRRWDNAINCQANSFFPDWNLLLKEIKKRYPEANVSLFCMQSSTDFIDDDVGLARSVEKGINSQIKIVRLFDCTLDEVKFHFASVDLLISMRLHGLILGALFGRRLIGIEYDPKVGGLLTDLGLAEYSVTYADGMFENLSHVLNKVESQCYCTRTLHKKALTNFNFIKMRK